MGCSSSKSSAADVTELKSVPVMPVINNESDGKAVSISGVVALPAVIPVPAEPITAPAVAKPLSTNIETVPELTDNNTALNVAELAIDITKVAELQAPSITVAAKTKASLPSLEIEVPLESTLISGIPSPVNRTPPPVCRGFVLKQGKTFSSWNNRYFVLISTTEAITLSYYVQSLEVPPYGKDLKGELDLWGYHLDINGDYLILQGEKGDRALKMEIKDPVNRSKWVAAFQAHLKFAGFD